MILLLTETEKRTCRALWRGVRTEVYLGGKWHAMPALAQAIILSAWDPFGVSLTLTQNRERQKRLVSPTAPRARSYREGRWFVDGALFPFRPGSSDKVRECQQLAAFVFLNSGRHLLWNDGTIEKFPH